MEAAVRQGSKVAVIHLPPGIALALHMAAASDGISPRSPRHSFITACLDAGVLLRDVQIAACHADPRTTGRYGRARHNLDRHDSCIVTAFIADASHAPIIAAMALTTGRSPLPAEGDRGAHEAIGLAPREPARLPDLMGAWIAPGNRRGTTVSRT